MADKPRVYLWDNVKALLIILVVIGHFLNIFKSSNETYLSLFLIIYTFHMPLFVFVSGLFIKSTYKNDKLNWNKPITFVVLYFILKLIIYVFRHSKPFDPLTEDGIPWYMLAMAAWIVITFVLRKVSPIIIVPLSIGGALAAGYCNEIGDFLVLSRIISYYPFFFLGYALNPTDLAEKMSGKLIKIPAAIVVVALCVISFMYEKQYNLAKGILLGSYSYDILKWPEYGVMMRFAWYIVAALVGASIIILIPKKKNILSFVGAGTISAYFWHRPILYLLTDLGVSEKIMYGLSAPYGEIVWLLVAVALTLLLSAPIFTKPFNNIMKIEYFK